MAAKPLISFGVVADVQHAVKVRCLGLDLRSYLARELAPFRTLAVLAVTFAACRLPR
jgi:hypothetical protein